MDRIILHSDINSCYASIEHARHPELAGKALAVAGSTEARHGIILAKDELAKRCGVKTGMVIWQAKRLCPELILLPPRMDLYLEFSRCVQEIYGEYTNLREPFGIDESWLDMSGCIGVGDGQAIAHTIRQRIKKEMGVTVSIGVSWNKVFAKLGSDYKKPDAVTCISRSNFKEIVWPLPVDQLLYIGPATAAKLRAMGIRSIGELAAADPEMLYVKLGKVGYIISRFANGRDTSPVRREDLSAPVKSIGNSTTTPRDLCCEDDVRITLFALAESVGMRLREARVKGKCLCVSIRSTTLEWHSHQIKLEQYTNITKELYLRGMALFRQMHRWPSPIRSLGLSLSELVSDTLPEQTDLFGHSDWRIRQENIDAGMDRMRKKYGFSCIQRGITGLDRPLGALNAKDDHIVHPVGFFGGH